MTPIEQRPAQAVAAERLSTSWLMRVLAAMVGLTAALLVRLLLVSFTSGPN